MSLEPSELAKLSRYLRAHRDRFALAVVRAPQLDVREELQRWVESLAVGEQRPYRLLDCTSLSANAVWEQITQGVPAGAMSVLTGLDEALQTKDGDLARLLNRQRERIAQLLPGPVLLVLGELALDRFLIDAPDLADWYAASFAFERATPATAENYRTETSPAPSELSRSLIQARISLLEQQLSEVGLRPESEARIWLELARLYYDLPQSAPHSDADPNPRPDPNPDPNPNPNPDPNPNPNTDPNFNPNTDLNSGLAPGVSRGMLDPATIQTLFEAAANASNRAVDLLRPLANRGPGYQARRGQALTMLSLALDQLGQREAASEAAQAAVSLYRVLADADADAFLPDLAMSLNNYANSLSALGQREPALAAARESVDTYRQLAQARPDAFLPNLAASLISYTAMRKRLRTTRPEAYSGRP